ncbi:MAG: glycosyltransferase [Chloroflexi bacterium]|nr:glycosyltransferase [Chloroflexota bacterium]
MIVSLIFTVKNEAASLPRLLDSILAQTRAPDEIIVVDGGSADATLAILRDYARRLPLSIISQPGANISQGRNAAIRAVRGDMICSTDAGVRLDANWLAQIVAPFQSDAVQAVAGFFVADPRGVFETALAATTLPALADIRPEKFLPSSRSVAFRKAAWQQAGGYPEWLDYCEDLIFDFKLKALAPFAFAPRAIAHFRPRENLRAFCQQYYQYARGDGKANLWRARHIIRYATYFVALPLLKLLTIAAPLAALPLWLVAALAMFYAPYQRVVPMLAGFPVADKLRGLAWVPIIRVAGDVAKMCGYPVGVVWRARHRGVDGGSR